MRQGPVRWAMPGVLLSMLLALGILGGSGPAPEAADPMPRTPSVLMPAVLPASVNAVRPDVQLAADRLTGTASSRRRTPPPPMTLLRSFAAGSTRSA